MAGAGIHGADANSSPAPLETCAGGKVILCGEHAVVHGGDAVVVGLARGVCARATPGEWSLTIGHRALSPEDPSAAALRAVGAYLGSEPAAVHVDVTMPLGVGLGGSAALAVAIARALGAMVEGVALPERTAFEAAQVWERVFHGNPSGVDAAAATYGGCILYNRDAFYREVILAGRAPLRLTPARPLTLAIAVAGPPSSTKTMVERVAAFRERAPLEFVAIFEEIQVIVTEARRCIEQGEAATLGALMSRNHELLTRWDLSTPQIENARSIALRCGALGSKLTGAGGGGCVVALCEDATLQGVLRAWQHAGYATTHAVMTRQSS